MTNSAVSSEDLMIAKAFDLTVLRMWVPYYEGYGAPDFQFEVMVAVSNAIVAIAAPYSLLESDLDDLLFDQKYGRPTHKLARIGDLIEASKNVIRCGLDIR